MKLAVIAAISGLLITQEALARPAISAADHAEFQQAVEDYQVFVVPRCAPDDVRAYVAARSERDSAFVKSLRGTRLAADYKHAVAASAKRDRTTAYECMRPPPPPPPPGISTPPPTREKILRDGRAEHFALGDGQFEKLARLRDKIMAARHK